MRRMITAVGLAAAIFAVGPAFADDAVKLDGTAIGTALTARVLGYDDGSTQDFKADGETIYTKGADSLGRWQVKGDQYCSVWPPSDVWACYDVTRSADGRKISFIAADGSVSAGVYADE